jgi:hypothetical protein
MDRVQTDGTQNQMPRQPVRAGVAGGSLRHVTLPSWPRIHNPSVGDYLPSSLCVLCASVATPSRRRGWGLIHLIGGMFTSALVLGTCVPLYVGAQRQAEWGIHRARMTATAREVTAAVQADVRQASSIRIMGGRELRLTLARASRPGVRDLVRYRQTEAGLIREVRPGAGDRPPERVMYGEPLVGARFTRQGKSVHAQLSFRRKLYGREIRMDLECSATPRSAL